MIAREGFPFIIGVLLAMVVYEFAPEKLVLSILSLMLVLFVWFFRNPHRMPANNSDGAVVSPASGKVLEIEEFAEFEGSTYKKVGIFMNIFNVHVNRIPVDGEVESVNHRDGRYLPADKANASIENEQNITTINTKYGKVVVKQIAGLVARRCVTYVKAGEKVYAGQELGIIKFSSRVDIYLPTTFELKVKVGDKVESCDYLAQYLGEDAKVSVVTNNAEQHN